MKKLKINQPVYKVSLPSGQDVAYTPFKIGHEKALQVALETENDRAIKETLRNVLDECLDVSGQKIDVGKLPTFDLEMLFLHLRARSIGETIDLKVTCPDDNETEVEVEIPIDKIKPKLNKDHSKEVKIGQYIFNMKYPGFDQFITLNMTGSEMEDVIKLIAASIDTIIDTETEEVIDAGEYGEAELVEFLESLPQFEFIKIRSFFDTMPKISYTVKIVNPKTKVKSSIDLEGMSAFLK